MTINDVFYIFAVIGIGYIARDVFEVLEPYTPVNPVGLSQHMRYLFTMLFFALSFCCVPVSGLIGLFKSNKEQ